MFNKDRILFALFIAIEIDLENKSIRPDEIEFVLKGNVHSNKIKSIYSWLNDDSFHHCRFLTEHFPNKFAQLFEHFDKHSTEWKLWIENDGRKLPRPFDRILNPFERLMLCRCFSSHRFLLGINEYVRQCLVLSSTFEFDSIFEYSTSTIPILFILASGFDPIEYLTNFAQQKSLSNLTIVSLAQGQEKFVLQALRNAQQQGTWLLIENCHLLLSFIFVIGKEIETSNETKSTFRLFMTTEPVDHFPSKST